MIIWVNFLCFQLFRTDSIYGFIAAYGIVAGAHRLWSHRSFKANFPLQVLLMILQTISMENDTIEWVRDHRVHHKYSDTNADPTNSHRGFFFSHMGWLMCKKHPDVKKYGAKIDMSDIEAEPVLQFQRKWVLDFADFPEFFLNFLKIFHSLDSNFNKFQPSFQVLLPAGSILQLLYPNVYLHVLLATHSLASILCCNLPLCPVPSHCLVHKFSRSYWQLEALR